MTATSTSDRLAELEVRMRELQVKRLEAVIRAKEARLQALRGARGPEAENYPPNDVTPPVVDVPPPAAEEEPQPAGVPPSWRAHVIALAAPDGMDPAALFGEIGGGTRPLFQVIDVEALPGGRRAQGERGVLLPHVFRQRQVRHGRHGGR